MTYLVSSFAVGLYLQHSRLWKVASIQLLAGAWKRQPQFYFTISNNYWTAIVMHNIPLDTPNERYYTALIRTGSPILTNIDMVTQH